MRPNGEAKCADPRSGEDERLVPKEWLTAEDWDDL